MTDPIQALIEKAEESVNAALSLAEDGYYDFAASRAYYAMFYVAEALLHLGQSYSKHSAVLSAFDREYARARRLDPKFHRWLIDAQDLRNIGDYGIEEHISKETADGICGQANEFIDAAKTYLSQ